MKKQIAVFVIISCLFQLYSCNSTLKKYERTEYGLFDTVITLTGYAEAKEDFDAAAKIVFDILSTYHKLTDIYHEYDDTVNAKTVNGNAGKEPVKVSRELFDYYRFAKDMAEKTKGACDLMLGAVTKLWKDASKKTADGCPSLPSDSEIEEALLHSGYSLLLLDEDALTLQITDSKASADLGATAKGYAVEMAAKALKNAGFDGYLLDAGGNIRTLGGKPSGDFNVGIRNRNGGTATVIPLRDAALVTGGSYNRYFTVDGKDYHHIIDRKTGYPAEYYISFSVKNESSAVSDALSTACFTLPPDEAEELIRQFPGTEYYYIEQNESVGFSDGFCK